MGGGGERGCSEVGRAEERREEDQDGGQQRTVHTGADHGAYSRRPINAALRTGREKLAGRARGLECGKAKRMSWAANAWHPVGASKVLVFCSTNSSWS